MIKVMFRAVWRVLFLVNRKDTHISILTFICWYTNLRHFYGKTHTKMLTVTIIGAQSMAGR